MGLQHIETKHFARPIRQQLVDRDEIAGRFRHLLAFDLQEAVVHPVIRHHGRTVGAARLCDLVFVVREDQIEAAAMDVEDIAEIGGAHRRALDMPARAAPAPRAFPTGLVVRRLFPEHKIGRVFLVGINCDTCAGLLLVEPAA